MSKSIPLLFTVEMAVPSMHLYSNFYMPMQALPA